MLASYLDSCLPCRPLVGTDDDHHLCNDNDDDEDCDDDADDVGISKTVS